MKLYLFLMIGLFFQAISIGQNSFTISGTVNDKNSGETIIGVNIHLPNTHIGTLTNTYGFYSLTLPKGKHKLVYSTIGYHPQVIEIDLKGDTKQNVSLEEKTESLEEVIIEVDTEKNSLRAPQMSINKLSRSTIKRVPVVLGESDVLKALLLLPGVSNAGEGSSGFNVRGGSADQNLILLDEATIYNSSHLAGFFSVFNPDAIKDLKLYKGGIPARFGGRASSVLDIYQKEGNSKNFKANGGLGVITSRLLLEGPFIEDKATFLLGGRGTYAHLFLPIFGNDNTLYFYDLNTKLNWRINEKNNFYLSGYFGRDVFSITNLFVNTYGNSLANFRWNHIYSNKLFSNLSLIYSDYYYGLKLDFVGFEWNSGIQNFNLKYDFKYYISDKFQFNFGLNNVYYSFNPGKIEPSSEESGIIDRQLTKNYANELALYAESEHKIGENLNLAYGLRFSHFTRLSQDEVFIYKDNNPLLFNPKSRKYISATPIDTLRNSNKPLKTYFNIEPRVSLAYQLKDNMSLKASYNRLAQYIHLLSNTNSPTPLDVWTPSGEFIKPQIANQFAVGFFKDFKNGIFSLETEIYFKTVKNRIDYINGAELIGNDKIETVILNGKSRAYGLEVLLKKNKGALQGWLSYTLSKSEMKTPGRNENETGINNGEWYASAIDRPHDIAVNATYKWTDKISLNANFLYQTGRPTNYPVGQFNFQNLTIPLFGDRNSQRLPAYHRFDLSMTLTPKKNKFRKWKSEWVFGIYNIYNRRNAASIQFSRNEVGDNEAVRTSIFGIVPSVTYNFKF